MKTTFFFTFIALFMAVNLNAQTEENTTPVSKQKVEAIYGIVDKAPEFPGGEEALMEFVGKNLNYPKEAAKRKIQGTVHVRFTVNSEGNVTVDRVLGTPDKLLAEEAIRIVNIMPKWIPGIRDGKTVSSYFIIPIKFVLK